MDINVKKNLSASIIMMLVTLNGKKKTELPRQK